MAIQSAPIETISVDLGYVRTKRVLDVVFTLLIAFPLLLICAIVALLILLDSRGPIIFRQKRVGRNGEKFEMLKFRSMHINCDDSGHRTATERYMNGGTLHDGADAPYKTHDDPRVTSIGKFIRASSLDELPQFWNVLRGDMSLVGPRPPLRLAGSPGLTGSWQVHGRSRVPFEEMIEMDIAYLQQQSLWEDIKIILLTVPVVILRRGGA